MARCMFCKRRFRSEQSVKAHLRFCPRYKSDDQEFSSALGTKPKAETKRTGVSGSVGPQLAPQAGSNPLSESFKTMFEAASKSKEQSPLQRRRMLLQEIKEQVINQYRTSKGSVTTAMRGEAKTAIERELSTVRLEELPHPKNSTRWVLRSGIVSMTLCSRSRCSRLSAIKQRIRHGAEKNVKIWSVASRQPTEGKLYRSRMGARRTPCEAKQIIGWDRLSVLCDINSTNSISDRRRVDQGGSRNCTIGAGGPIQGGRCDSGRGQNQTRR